MKGEQMLSDKLFQMDCAISIVFAIGVVFLWVFFGLVYVGEACYKIHNEYPAKINVDGDLKVAGSLEMDRVNMHINGNGKVTMK